MLSVTLSIYVRPITEQQQADGREAIRRIATVRWERERHMAQISGNLQRSSELRKGCWSAAGEGNGLHPQEMSGTT